MPSSLAVAAVRSITACLIRHRFAHPDQGFPRSLAGIGTDWNCDRDLLQPGNIKDYWIFYTPVESDGARISDFRLIVLPRPKSEPGNTHAIGHFTSTFTRIHG